MAERVGTRLTIEDVRASMQRIRDQGEKLVDRIRSDAKDLIARAPNVVSIDEARKRLEEARQRAEEAVKAVRDLRTRRAELLGDLVERAIRAVGLARAEEVTRLETRVADLERRVERIAKREEQAA